LSGPKSSRFLARQLTLLGCDHCEVQRTGLTRKWAMRWTIQHLIGFRFFLVWVAAKTLP